MRSLPSLCSCPPEQGRRTSNSSPPGDPDGRITLVQPAPSSCGRSHSRQALTPTLPVSDTARDSPVEEDPGSPQAFGAGQEKLPGGPGSKGLSQTQDMVCLSPKHLARRGSQNSMSSGDPTHPWMLIKQLTSSLFLLWGHLSIVSMTSPPLLFHLGRATRLPLGPSPCSRRPGWTAGQREAGWAQADPASPRPFPTPHFPACFQDQTALSWLTNGFNTNNSKYVGREGERKG